MDKVQEVEEVEEVEKVQEVDSSRFSYFFNRREPELQSLRRGNHLRVTSALLFLRG